MTYSTIEEELDRDCENIFEIEFLEPEAMATPQSSRKRQAPNTSTSGSTPAKQKCSAFEQSFLEKQEAQHHSVMEIVRELVNTLKEQTNVLKDIAGALCNKNAR